MAKNKAIKLSPVVVRNLIVVFFAAFIMAVIYQRTMNFFTRDPMFTVKEVMLEPALVFMKSDELLWAKGKNIFLVDINRIERKLRFQYPQIAHLKVCRKFPDQIFVSATKLNAFVQLRIKDNFFAVDPQGIVLSVTKRPFEMLPLVKGIRLQQSKIILGRALKDEQLSLAVNVVNLFPKIFNRSQLRVSEIDISNSTKIEALLTNNLKIIIDENNIADKINMLRTLLVQNKIDLKTVAYIDLRFPQPIVGHN